MRWAPLLDYNTDSITNQQMPTSKEYLLPQQALSKHRYKDGPIPGPIHSSPKMILDKNTGNFELHNFSSIYIIIMYTQIYIKLIIKPNNFQF